MKSGLRILSLLFLPHDTTRCIQDRPGHKKMLSAYISCYTIDDIAFTILAVVLFVLPIFVRDSIPDASWPRVFARRGFKCRFHPNPFMVEHFVHLHCTVVVVVPVLLFIYGSADQHMREL